MEGWRDMSDWKKIEPDLSAEPYVFGRRQP
jgi:hypothetical protein